MKRLAALLLSLCALAVQADDGAIRKTLEEKLKIKIEKIGKTPLNGIYEVIAGDRLFYTDEKGSYFLDGELIETKTLRSLTAEKRFAMLPLDLAVKTVRGNGKNVVVTFEDPHCGYCKKLAKELSTMKDVTVYTFLLPILSEDSLVKSKNIWCAADRSKTWNDWMLSGTNPPAAPGTCDATPMFSRMQSLQRTMEISGTPFIYFPNGNIARGYLSAAEIEKRFTQVVN